MAKDSSFDIVSEVDMQEMDNSVNQTEREISQRYDFKDSKSSISLELNTVKIIADDEYKLEAIIDMLMARMAKRSISLKCLDRGKIEPASKGTIRQIIEIKKGINKEAAKEIVAHVKKLKLKVQAQIQDDQVRITGAKKDDLQNVIQSLKEKDFGVDLQFVNFR